MSEALYAIEEYKNNANKWLKLSFRKQKLLVDAVSDLKQSHRGVFTDHTPNFVIICEQFGVKGSAKPHAKDTGAATSERYSSLPVSDDYRGDRTKARREFLAPILYWFAYFFPTEASAYFSLIDWQFKKIPTHPLLNQHTIKTYTNLALIRPTLAYKKATALRFDYCVQGASFTGRDKEIRQLFDFLQDDPNMPFKWWQIAGGAGSGKSRLALELMDRIKASEFENDWEYGFVEFFDERFWDHVQAWRPQKHTLIIIDYATSPSKAERTIDLFEHLYGHRKYNNGYQIRVLLLDRQPYLSRSAVKL